MGINKIEEVHTLKAKIHMVEPTLQRQVSTVPTAAVQTESTVLSVPISSAWDKFRNFRFD